MEVVTPGHSSPRRSSLSLRSVRMVYVSSSKEISPYHQGNKGDFSLKETKKLRKENSPSLSLAKSQAKSICRRDAYPTLIQSTTAHLFPLSCFFGSPFVYSCVRKYHEFLRLAQEQEVRCPKGRGHGEHKPDFHAKPKEIGW